MQTHYAHTSSILQGCSHQLSGGAVDTITRGVAREMRRTRRVWRACPPGNFAFMLSVIPSAILGNIARLYLPFIILHRPRRRDSAAKNTAYREYELK